MNPQVIHLIMCDRAHYDRRNLLRLNINGLHVRIRTDQPPPVRHDFVAVVMMTGFQGSGELWLRVVREVTNQRVAETQRRRVRFPQDPEELHGFRSQVQRCMLPAHGRYRLELWLDGTAIATHPFWLLPKV